MQTLEQGKNKLERLNNDFDEISKKIKREHELIPFGQPNIIGRRNIYKTVQGYYEKQRKILEEYDKQKNMNEMLEKKENFKNDNKLLVDVHAVGKTRYGTVGAKTSVNNLDYFRDKLEKMIQDNEQAKAYNKTKPKIKMTTLGASITKLKNKIKYLEEMQEKSEKPLSDSATRLIESGDVTQWKKKPIYYFVNGLRKVALEIGADGNFKMSTRYPAYSEQDQ